MPVQHPYFHLECHVGSLFQMISHKSYDQLLYLVTVMRSLCGERRAAPIKRVEMSLEEFVAGERWMTPEEQAEDDYDQCLRPD